MPHYIVESIEFDFSDSMGTITEQEQEFITDNALGLWWVDCDPTQGASSDELTEICNSLYDRCLLAELGIKGFTPANEQILKRV